MQLLGPGLYEWYKHMFAQRKLYDGETVNNNSKSLLLGQE